MLDNTPRLDMGSDCPANNRVDCAAMDDMDCQGWCFTHCRSCCFRGLKQCCGCNLVRNFQEHQNWLVVWTPLKNISQLGWLFPIYRKIKNVPNHQPEKTARILHFLGYILPSPLILSLLLLACCFLLGLTPCIDLNVKFTSSLAGHLSSLLLKLSPIILYPASWFEFEGKHPRNHRC